MTLSGYVFWKEKRNFENIKKNIVQIHSPARIIDLPPEINSIEHTSEIFVNGIFLSWDTVITVNHGIWKITTNVEIKDMFGKVTTGKVIYNNEEKDFALIQIQAEKTRNIALPFTKNIEIWAKVKSYSIRDGFHIYNGKVLDIKEGKIYTDIPLSPGDSGSLLINEQGEIIGMNTAYDVVKKRGIAHFFSQKILENIH